jgi:hypothetical protein
LPAGYAATSGNSATASQHNQPLEDLESDMNTARPISTGGTGATTAVAARAALGVEIGSDVQAFSAALTDLADAGEVSAAGKFLLSSAAGDWDYEDLVGTVSQSGGVPTGALFERGVNANGEYIRIANGTQICISNVFTADATTPVGALYKWASNQTWAFPAAFAAVPSVTPGATNNTSLTATCATTTTTDITVNVLNALSVAGRSASFIAIGRWF